MMDLKKRNSVMSDDISSQRTMKQDTNRFNSLSLAMEKKLNQIVEQLSNQILKQRLDINGFKQELDMYHTTLDLVSRQIKDRMQEITVMQNYQLESIDRKFSESKTSFDEHIQHVLERVMDRFDKQLSNRPSEKWIEVKEEENVSSQLAVQDSQIGDMGKRLAMLEKQMNGVFRKFDVRQDDEKQALVILNLLKNDGQRKLQEVFQERFRKDAAEVFENGLSPFRVLMETRVATSMSNLQSFSLAIRRMERSMQEHSETIDIYKREIINVQKNVDKNLGSYQEELDRVAKLVPDFTEFQEICDEQIQGCQQEIGDIRQQLQMFEDKMEQQTSCVEKLIAENSQQHREDIFEKLNNLEQSMSHRAKEQHVQSSLTQSISVQHQPQHSYDYLNQVERQIKQIYKRIKYIKLHDGFGKELPDRSATKSQLYSRRVELIPKQAEIQYYSNQSDTLVQVQAKTVKLKHHEFQKALNQKDVFIPLEKNKFLSKPLPNTKLYQHIISDEQFYQQYKNQIDDIQEKLHLKFEVGNSQRNKSPSPTLFQKQQDIELQLVKFPPRIVQHNLNQKVVIKEEEQPLSINNQILRNRKQVQQYSFSNPNSRNLSRSEDHGK